MLLVVLIPGLLNAAQPRFYISTGQIFAPGEDAFVTVETRGISYVDIRVYRVDDVTGFFKSQADAHQPWELNEYSGVNALSILTDVLDRDLRSFRDLVRSFINDDIRTGLAGQNKGLKRAGFPSQPKVEHPRVKLLDAYPLSSHFRHEFGGGASGGWIYEHIPISENKTGVFLVEAVHRDHVGYTLVIVSDLALVTKQSGDTLLCYAVNKSTGNPVPGAELTFLQGEGNDKGKQLAEGKTGADGIFKMPLKESPQLTIVARKDKQCAVIDPVYFPVSVDHRKVYIYTDRPVYRPSQQVFFKGIVRDFTDEQYHTVSDAPVHLKVFDPRGNTIFETDTSLNDMGTFHGKFKLGAEPALGTYKVIAFIQGKAHQGEFKIKAYKKPKFRVKVQLKGTGLNGTEVNGRVIASYYFGAPVPGATVKYYVYRTRFYIPWWINEDYKWYYSESEYRTTRQELVNEGEGKLDEKGGFRFTFKTKPGDYDYNYRVEARVRDKSNFTVSGENVIRASKGQYNIDVISKRLVYSPKQKINLSFYTRNLNNRSVSAAFTFKALLLTPGKDGEVEKEVFSKSLQTRKDGRAGLSFKLKRIKGHVKLVARGVDEFNNEIISSTSIYLADKGQSVAYAGEGIEMVADRFSYRPGDTARFLVLSRMPGIPFLFTVEGGNLYRYKVHRFIGNACVVDLPLTTQYTPNVFVTASTMFDGRFYSRNKNIIIPPVDKLLTVELKTAKEIYKPGEPVTVDVQVKNHKKRGVQVELSLGVVDESIYAISPELAVEMQKFFYPRKRNSVRTNHSLVFSFYGYSRQLKKELAALEMRGETGLSSFKGSSRSVRRVFKDTCFWTPAVMTSRDGRARLTFNLPGNITQWRLTARCVNSFTQLGGRVSKIISRKNLSVTMDPPLTFTEGDAVTLPVTIRNLSPKDMTGSFNFKVKGARLDGDFEKTFKTSAGQYVTLPLKLKVSGKKEVVLQASAAAGAEKDGISLTVPVTPYGVMAVKNLTATLEPGEKRKQVKFELPGDAVKHYTGAKVYVHTGVYRAVLSSLNYLAKYPYGCVEQTMSAFLPDVILAGVLENQKIDNPVLKENVKKYIDAGVERLLRFQNQTGGWGWFNEKEPDPYMTAYVMYGLIRARGLGHAINQKAYDKGLAALEKLLEKEIPPDIRVFAIYDLALSGNPPLSMIMDAFNKRRTLSTYARSLLTLAAVKAGKTNEAQILSADLLATAVNVKEQHFTHWKDKITYRRIANDADVETTAAVLQALLVTRPKSPEIMAAVRWLMMRREDSHWHSTRDTAAAVMALSDYLAASGISEDKNQSLKFRLNKGPWQTVAMETLYSDKGESVADIPVTAIKSGSNLLELEKTGRGDIFMNLGFTFHTRQIDTGTTGGPLQIRRTYFRMASNEDGGPNETVIDGPAVFQPGEEFLVKTVIQAGQDYEYMVLEDFIPAGFQVIENTAGYRFSDNGIAETLRNGPQTYKEVRDNRNVFFFNHLKKGQLVVYSLMRAALEGRYNVNPAVIRSMYYSERRALSSRLEVSVKEEEGR